MSIPEVEFLLDLLKIYSPTGYEGELAKYLVSRMRDLGFQAHTDAVGNVVGEVKGKGPRVLLCGHMDTVPGFIPVKIEGDEVWGRGAVDAKGPLATLILAAKRYVNLGGGLNLIIAGVVEEEGSSRGMYHLIETIEEPDVAVFGEPSGISSLAIGYKGGINFKLTIKTERGHSSSPWFFKNSIEEAWSLWEGLKKRFDDYNREGSKFHSLTYCLTAIDGGGKSVFVPSRCTLTFNVRIPPKLKCQDVIELVKSYVQHHSTSRGIKVDVKWSDCVEAYVASRSSIIARAFTRAVSEELNVKPSFVFKTGTSDINVAATKWRKAEMVAYGPGDSSLDHTAWERISVSGYLKSISVLTRTLWWAERLVSSK
ncbi:MAG: M20/M25/M40 family metallo-hydrolase [Candidatus Nezhaarchaeota archaeon]|nr:M20/M25/M40 family metallo-hydrolase [Candidatus Nezhaarchaeota archaeon]MCX8141501.1 M20/M25/M40 family metallo-hydrolase [Candidatus Nezhaarchaeota archaeon]MDW8049768.1 M20/M25/M40 family metallo-hydrolase [Nitrososphaerota archaeon]